MTNPHLAHRAQHDHSIPLHRAQLPPGGRAAVAHQRPARVGRGVLPGERHTGAAGAAGAGAAAARGGRCGARRAGGAAGLRQGVECALQSTEVGLWSGGRAGRARVTPVSLKRNGALVCKGGVQGPQRGGSRSGRACWLANLWRRGSWL